MMHTFFRRMMIFLSLGFSLCALLPHFAFAETVLDSWTIIPSDTTWTKDGSPYIIQDGLMIGGGATLHIDPGVVVGLAGASDGEIDVDGGLDAEGTSDEPITFQSVGNLFGDYPDLQSQGLQSNPWSLLVFGGSVHLQNTNISGVSDGIQFFNGANGAFDSANITDGGVQLFNSSSLFATSTTISNVHDEALGVYKNSTAALASSSISSIDSNDAIGLYGASATISNSQISDTTGDAIETFLDYGNRSNLSLISSTIKNAGEDAIFSQNTDVNIASSTIDTATDGIATFGGANISIATSTIQNLTNAGLEIYGSNATITDSTITNAPEGIEDYGALVDITNSTLSSTTDYAILNSGSKPVLAQNDFWGDSSGPYESTLNPDGLGGSIGDFVPGNITFSPWLTFDPTVGPTPVIIIPGILGSAEKHGVWLIDPIFHVYDNLIATLEANGYVASTTLFTLPYDWRNSNTDTAVLLKAKIDEVKGICGCSKVDIVAHSMGGLVARAYAESPDYDDDIDQLIFLGTPQRGAPEDYLMWEGGETNVNDFVSGFTATYLEYLALKAGHLSIFNYVHDFPITSVQELLPIYSYLTVASTSDMIQYPNGYPQNTFLENLDTGLSALLSSGIHITNIIGNTGTSTITGINIVGDSTKAPEWTDGYPQDFSNVLSDRGLEYGPGDTTVPESSASLGVPFDVELNAVHTWLPSEAEENIYEKIHGGELTTEIKEPIPTRFLTAWMHSPADMVVIAPDGTKIGKDFSTGQEFNQIPGAFYSGFDTDDEFITIPDPTDGDYQVQTQGTGSGEYEVSLNNISDTGAPESIFTGTTSVGAQSALSFSVSSTSVSDITQDQTTQSQPQKVIFNTRVSGGNHSVIPISAPPVSTIFNPDTFMVTVNVPIEVFTAQFKTAYALALASEAKPPIPKNLAKANTINTKLNTEVASVHQAVSELGGASIMNWIEGGIIGTIKGTANIISNIFKK